MVEAFEVSAHVAVDDSIGQAAVFSTVEHAAFDDAAKAPFGPGAFLDVDELAVLGIDPADAVLYLVDAAGVCGFVIGNHVKFADFEPELENACVLVGCSDCFELNDFFEQAAAHFFKNAVAYEGTLPFRGCCEQGIFQ